MLGYKFRRRSHVDQHFALKDPHAAEAELSVLRRKTVHHQLVSFEEIVYRCRV